MVQLIWVLLYYDIKQIFILQEYACNFAKFIASGLIVTSNTYLKKLFTILFNMFLRYPA